MVGHNPGVEELLTLLTGHVVELPTASLARLELDLASWCQLTPHTRATLAACWRPRELDQRPAPD